MVDMTQRPLKIPQKYIDYLDRNRIHHLMERMYEEVLIRQPADPLQLLVDFLEYEAENPEPTKIIIRSCKPQEEMELAIMLAMQTRAVILTRYDTIYDVTRQNAELKAEMDAKGGKVSPQLLSKILAARIREEDCQRNGWILTGAPEDRAESMYMQMAGVLATHALLITDGLEVEQPPPAKYQQPLTSSQRFMRRLRHMLDDSGPMTRLYRNTEGLEGLEDMLEDVIDFIGIRGRETAPMILRMALLGLPGSGCRTQARRIARKHSLVHVHCGTLIRAAVKNEIEDPQCVKEFLHHETTPPDELVMSIVKSRLLENDCRTRGWVLTGFPRTALQCEMMMESEVFPNRLVLLDAPPEICVDRLMSRRFEPASGQAITLTEDIELPTDVTRRLKRHPDDDPRVLRQIMEERSSTLLGVVSLMEDQIQIVDSAVHESEVAESVEKIAVFQVPKPTLS